MRSFLSKLFGRAPTPANSTVSSPLDYEKAVMLDAEDLAEGGIADAYQQLLPKLQAFVAEPDQVEDIMDDDLPSYAIRCNGTVHLIYSANEPDTESESWGRATYFLFHIVNEQLASAPVRFYAINGGNDLCGMFLTPAQALEAQRSLPRRQDWPYIPEIAGPNYGSFS